MKNFLMGIISTMMMMLGFENFDTIVDLVNTLDFLQPIILIILGAAIIALVVFLIVYTLLFSKKRGVKPIVDFINRVSKDINYRRYKIDKNLAILKPTSPIIEQEFFSFQEKISDLILNEDGSIDSFRKFLFSLFGVVIEVLEEDPNEGTCLIGGIRTDRGYITFA